MFLSKRKPGAIGSVGVIGGLTLLFLGGIVASLPDAPIRTKAKATNGKMPVRGYVVSASELVDGMCSQLAKEGCTLVAIDLTDANMDGEAFWRGHLEHIRTRSFPVWAWVDVTSGLARAREVGKKVPVEGLFLYGKNAASAAKRLDGIRDGLQLIAVVPPGTTGSVVARSGASLLRALETGGLDNLPLTVILAADLGAADQAKLGAAVTGEFLIVTTVPGS